MPGCVPLLGFKCYNMEMQEQFLNEKQSQSLLSYQLTNIWKTQLIFPSVSNIDANSVKGNKNNDDL